MLILDKVNKKIGVGSSSILLCAIGIIFDFTFKNKECLGDIILKFIGLNPWSNGIHHTIFYSLIFFIPSVIIGFKYKNNFGASLGKIVSLIMIILILLLNPAFLIRTS